MADLALDSSAITWDSPLHESDFMPLFSDFIADTPFRKLTMFQKRFSGRAFAEVSNLRLSILVPPGVDASVVVAFAPERTDNNAAPGSMAAMLRISPTILRSTPFSGTASASVSTFPTGVSWVIPSADTSTIIGHPPHVYASCTAHQAATDSNYKKDIKLIFSYTVSLRGYAWISPNDDLSADLNFYNPRTSGSSSPPANGKAAQRTLAPLPSGSSQPLASSSPFE